MADKKISALTAATTPLAGTEVLPIVQGGATVKVSVDDLTTGKVVTTGPIISVGAGKDRLVIEPQNAGTGALLLGTNSAGNAYTPVAIDNSTTILKVTGTEVARTSSAGLSFAAGKGITTGGATALGFGVNNAVDAMTIDTSKNVGVGTTTPTSGSMSNSAIVNAGVFSTLRGSVASTSGVAATIATANQNHALATYIVSCGVSSGAPTAYSAVAIVSADNNTLRVTNLQTATNMTISVSGTDIQATQTSGGTPNILFAVTRVA